MTDIVPEPELLLSESLTSPENIEEPHFTTLRVTPENQELWLKMGQLRAIVYLDKKFITEAEINEDGAEYDEYDDQADHFVAVNDKDDVIGTVRVIHRHGDQLVLPAEKAFGVALPEQMQEISRFLRDPELPQTEGILVSLALMRAALKATRDQSETIYAVLENDLHRQLSKHIGIHLKTLGDPKVLPEYNNTLNHLVEMEPLLITSQIHERDMQMLERVKAHPRLGETILGKPYASFFERYSRAKGLGRVSLSDLTEPNPDQFDRNGGFYSPEEQEKLWQSTVGVIGAGGDGGQLAITLAMAGVRHFKVADPEYYSIENLNRQTGASLATIGKNKAEVIAGMLRDLGATVEVYRMGITEENIAEFAKGTDLLLDESEFTMPHLGVMVSEEARKENIPVLMTLNVGFGSYTTAFAPDGMTFQEYLGLDRNMTTAEVKEWAETEGNHIPIAKWAPHIPSYANVGVLQQVETGERSAPTVVQGVMSAAAEAGTQAVALLLKDVNPNWESWISWAPHGKVVDAKDGSFEVKARGIHFSRSVAVAALKTKTGKSHPKR